MPHALTSSVAGAVVVAVVAVFPYPSELSARNQAPRPQTRTIYASATDKNGTAITDLQAADFEIKDGGKAASIVSVAPSCASRFGSGDRRLSARHRPVHAEAARSR
jgi:hypothetical protein